MGRVRYVIRTFPSRISAVCFIAGFALILTGWLPIRIVRCASPVLGFLMPFFRLPTNAKGEREAAANASSVPPNEAPRVARPPAAPAPPPMRQPGTEPS